MRGSSRLRAVSRGTTLVVGVLATSAYLCSSLRAEGRKPIRSHEQRSTELKLDRYDEPLLVERVRTWDKTYAIFHADPQEIDANAVILDDPQAFQHRHSAVDELDATTVALIECGRRRSYQTAVKLDSRSGVIGHQCRNVIVRQQAIREV